MEDWYHANIFYSSSMIKGNVTTGMVLSSDKLRMKVGQSV